MSRIKSLLFFAIKYSFFFSILLKLEKKRDEKETFWNQFEEEVDLHEYKRLLQVS